MTAPETWAARLTRSVAAEVRRRRREREWSAQQLSDECARLGFDLPRSAIADLENNRRVHFGIPDLLVLARALNVPPLLLVFPVGTGAEAEVLPGEFRAPFRAAQWFGGEMPFPDPDDSVLAEDIVTVIEAARQGPARPLWFYRAFDQALEQEARLASRADGMTALAADAVIDAERKAFTEAAAALREEAVRVRVGRENLRELAEAEGIVPPGLNLSRAEETEENS